MHVTEEMITEAIQRAEQLVEKYQSQIMTCDNENATLLKTRVAELSELLKDK